MSVATFWSHETALSKLNNELKSFYFWSLYLFIYVEKWSQERGWPSQPSRLQQMFIWEKVDAFAQSKSWQQCLRMLWLPRLDWVCPAEQAKVAQRVTLPLKKGDKLGGSSSRVTGVSKWPFQWQQFLHIHGALLKCSLSLLCGHFKFHSVWSAAQLLMAELLNFGWIMWHSSFWCTSVNKNLCACIFWEGTVGWTL